MVGWLRIAWGASGMAECLIVHGGLFDEQSEGRCWGTSLGRCCLGPFLLEGLYQLSCVGVMSGVSVQGMCLHWLVGV